jgi:flagellar biosynthesis protein FliQ
MDVSRVLELVRNAFLVTAALAALLLLISLVIP